jgi:hypothetical protein
MEFEEFRAFSKKRPSSFLYRTGFSKKPLQNGATEGRAGTCLPAVLSGRRKAKTLEPSPKNSQKKVARDYLVVK